MFIIICYTVGVDLPISPIYRENCAALTDSSIALNTPLRASTPLKNKVYPTYSFFSLITGNENDGEPLENIENSQNQNVLKDKNDSILNTPKLGRNTRSSTSKKSESILGVSPTGYEFAFENVLL
jgi:hypothetical protein